MKKTFGRLSGRFVVVTILILSAVAAVFTLAPSSQVLAANPTTMNFQGKVVNANGTNVANNTYPFVFRIYNTPTPTTATACSSDATCLFEETQSSVSVTSGVFQVELGSGCAGGLVASNACTKSVAGGLNFNSNSALYLVLKFNNDAAGFMNNPIHLTSVPYAFYADNAGLLGGIAATGFIKNVTSVQSANIAVQAASSGSVAAVLQANASGSGDILDLKNGSNVAVATFGSTGATLFKTSATSANAFQIQDNSGVNYINVNTVTPNITLGEAFTGQTITLNGEVTVSSDRTFTANGPATFQNSTNSVNAFAIKNGTGGSLLNVNNFDLSNTNIIQALNPSIELPISGNWTLKVGGSPPAQDSTQHINGNYSLKDTTPATADAGVLLAKTLADSTTYTLSFEAKLDGSSAAFATLAAGYSPTGLTAGDNSNLINCTLNSTTVVTTGWTRYFCTFQTAASHSGTPYIYIKQTNAAAHIFYIDAVQLLSGTAPNTPYQEGSLQIYATLDSPINIMNASNSTNAFQIQNVAGNNLFNVDTLNSQISYSPPSLIAGQNNIVQTITNASTTGGAVQGYNQSITVSNTTTASTTNGFNISIADNASSISNTDRGINISLSGSNTSRTDVGVDVSVSRGLGIRSISSGSNGNANTQCNSLNIGVGVCAGDTGGANSGTGVYAYSNSRATTNIYDPQGSAVYGLNNGGGTSGAFYAGVKGITTQTATAAYTSIGVYGLGKAGSTASAYGGYFGLDSTSGTTLGAALYASNSSIAANILVLQDNTTSVFTVADAGAATFKNSTDSTAGFQIQRAGAGGNLLVADTSNSQVTVQGINSVATLGSELLSSSTCSGTNWSGTGTGPYTHSTGSTVNLSCTPPASVSSTGIYQLVFTVGGSVTPGSTITPKVGFGAGDPVGAASTNETQLISAAGGTTNMVFTPSSNFNGTITIISLKQVTLASNNVLAINNSDGSTGIEIRSGGSSLNNTLIGISAGRSVTTGSFNTALGVQALQNTTTGLGNTAIGYQALQFNTTGYNNTALGSNALGSNTTGIENAAFGSGALQNAMASDNTAFGYGVLGSNTVGNQNTGLGAYSLGNTTTGTANTGFGYITGYSNITGSFNTFLGNYAGYQDPNTATFATLSNLQNATAVGYGSQIQQSNSLVLGGQGANSVNVGIGTTAPTNTFSVSPDIFDTGTACQGANTSCNTTGTSIFGALGASWTANMVGNEIIFADGTKYTITGYVNSTQLTVGTSAIKAASAYRIHNPAFYVSSSGSAAFRTSINSTTAFQLQNATGQNVFAADTTNGKVLIGNAGAGVNGTIVFNNSSNSNTVTIVSGATGTSYSLTLPTTGPATSQCLQTDSVTASQLKFASCSGGGATLASAYNSAATTGNTITVTSAGGAVIIKDAATSIGTTFDVQNSAGSSLLNVDSSINNISLLGNNSGEVAPWSTNTSNPLPLERREAATVYAKGYVYVMGGWNSASAYQSTIYYAKVNTDGSIGTWNTSGVTLPVPLRDEKAVYANGYIYVTGGSTTGGTVQTATYYAKVNNDGTINAWQNGSPLTVALWKHTIQAVNGYLYVFGGNNGTTDQSATYYIKLNADGSMAAATWTTSGATAIGARADLTSAYANGYMYALGGSNSTTTYFATINPLTGVLGNWTSAGSATLPAGIKTSGTVVANGYIYTIGGFVGSVQVTTVQYAPLLSTGGIGSWTSPADNSLPLAREQAGVFTANGYIYDIGGFDGTAADTTVYYTSTSRLKVGGSLDLVGIGGENLADASGTGGSLTAGNGIFTGTLNVQDQVTFSGALNVGGTALFMNNANSTSAFQVNNATGQAMFGINTTNSKVSVGSNTTDTNQVLFQTDSFSTFADTATCSTTTNQGAVYYNTSSNAVRGCINGAWEDVVTTAGLGLMLFGVVPDSGSNPGDLASLVTPAVTGPCKVSYLTASSVSVAPCVAYSAGRKVVVATTTSVTGLTTASRWYHICFDSTTGALAALSNASETGGLPTFSVNDPVLCIADVQTNATPVISAVYDIRPFTNSIKQTVTVSATAAGLGQLVTMNGANVTKPAATAALVNVMGVVVATDGGTSTTNPNAIITVNGPAVVKATAGTAGQLIETGGTTAGYAITIAAAATATQYTQIGFTKNTFPGTACTTTANAVNCGRSLYFYAISSK